MPPFTDTGAIGRLIYDASHPGFLVTGLAKLRAAAFQDNTLLAHLAHCAAAVIFDEAHQAVAATYSFITEQLCSARLPLLGLTATPGRTANLTDADYRLADMFDHNKISIDPRGHDSPVTYLIQNRYLADAHFVPIGFESDAAITEPATRYGLQHWTIWTTWAATASAREGSPNSPRMRRGAIFVPLCSVPQWKVLWNATSSFKPKGLQRMS